MTTKKAKSSTYSYQLANILSAYQEWSNGVTDKNIFTVLTLFGESSTVYLVSEEIKMLMF